MKYILLKTRQLLNIILFRLRLLSVLGFFMAFVPVPSVAQENVDLHLKLQRDTIAIDIPHPTLSRLCLENAIEYKGNIYCIFYERRYCSNWGWDNCYFCIIDTSTKTISWQKCNRRSKFAINQQEVVPYSEIDSIVVSDGYQKLMPKTIYDDEIYKVDFMNLGEWGCFTWVYHKPLHKHLLYPISLCFPVRIGDTLFMENEAGIWFLNSELIAKAKKGFCSPEKCRKRDECWWIEKFYGKTNKTISDKQLEKRVEKAAKNKLTDTIGSFLTIQNHPHYIWDPEGDTTIRSLMSLEDKLVALVDVVGVRKIVLVTDKGMTQLCEIGFNSGKPTVDKNVQDGSVLLYSQENNETSNILFMKETAIHQFTLIQRQDTVTKLEYDTFDTMLSLIHNHHEDLSFECIDKQETQHGSVSDRFEWELLESESFFRPYYQILTDNSIVETVYWLDADEKPSVIMWNFGNYLDPDAEFESAFNAPKQKLNKEIIARIIRILGTPEQNENGVLRWEHPEGIYRFNDFKRRGRLTFNCRTTQSDNEQ
ncbi:MAG: hypothetical protein KBT45_02425 [Bacteroidales bacterium]|nr:hypothetical protein [Candidatus Colimorpha pelethequi]